MQRERKWRSVADQLRGKFPKLGVLMDEAECDVLAFMTFPRAHWTQIYSTNPLERLNAAIKRRTNVVGIFPNDASITRLVGAMMLEQNDGLGHDQRLLRLRDRSLNQGWRELGRERLLSLGDRRNRPIADSRRDQIRSVVQAPAGHFPHDLRN